jgi:hypothetical protein
VPTLISQFEQGLKKDIRVAMVLVPQSFNTVEEISNLAIKIDNKLHGVADTSTVISSPSVDPNAMDLSAVNTRLSDEEKLRRMRTGNCFRCNGQGHIASHCPDRKNDRQDKSYRKKTSNFMTRISELEVKLAAMNGKDHESDDRGEGSSRADNSKNGGAQA